MPEMAKTRVLAVYTKSVIYIACNTGFWYILKTDLWVRGEHGLGVSIIFNLWYNMLMNRLSNQMIYIMANTLRRANIKLNEGDNPNVIDMRNTIDSLENKGINFYIEQSPDGSWVAQSTNIDGIMTGGSAPNEIPDMLKDAIFTYFEIPPQFCNTDLLRGSSEPVRVQQRVTVSA